LGLGLEWVALPQLDVEQTVRCVDLLKLGLVP
jgi:hypothetical protein